MTYKTAAWLILRSNKMDERCYSRTYTHFHGYICTVHSILPYDLDPHSLRDPGEIRDHFLCPENMHRVAMIMSNSDIVVGAWGTSMNHTEHVVTEMMRKTWELSRRKEILCFGVNQNGSPKGPGSIKTFSVPTPYRFPMNKERKRKTVKKFLPATILALLTISPATSNAKRLVDECNSLSAKFNAYESVAETHQEICAKDGRPGCLDDDYKPSKVNSVRGAVQAALNRNTASACNSAASRIP